MKTQTVEATPMAETLASLRQELARLGERVAALEQMIQRIAGSSLTTSPPHHLTTSPPTSPPQADGPSEEILLVIAAAIAAFLGKKGHIRQIRLLGATGWAQQGRVTIQASHALAGHYARS
jgi:methylmalonyl-CoA carboxyltransferase large subunit